jgi:hypothetical protein
MPANTQDSTDPLTMDKNLTAAAAILPVLATDLDHKGQYSRRIQSTSIKRRGVRFKTMHG